MRQLALFLPLALVLLFGCGESERAKRAKVANWVSQLKNDPQLADKEEFTKPLEDYADIAAPEFANLLGEPNKPVQIAALKVLAKLKRLSVVDAIVAVTKSPDPELRMEVAKTLAAFGSPLTVKPLMEMTKDPNPKVRAAALEGLGGPGGREAPPYLREVLPYLAAALNDPNPQIRQGAVNGLVKLGQWSLQAIAKVQEEGSPVAKKEAEKAFREICEGFRKDLLENTDRLIRRDMARYLGELRYARAAVDLVKKLEDPDPEVKSACAYALGKIGAKHAAWQLREVMKNKGEEMPVRLATAVALGQMGDQQAVGFLIKQLNSDDEKVRSAAVEALRTIGKPAARLLMQAAKDKDPLKRWGAVTALGETGDIGVVPILLQALRDKSADVRAVAAASLGKLRYRPSAQQLVEALADKDERVQAHAEWALENIGEGSIPALLEGAKRSTIRIRVFRLLGRLKAKRAVPVLTEGLRDQKAQARAMAAWALGEVGDRSAITAVQDALKDKDADVRREAVLALGKLGGEEVRILLSAHLKADKNPQVRTAVGLALRQVGR